MQKSTDGGNSFDEAGTGNPRTGQPVIGDADNVQKTTWVVGEGTNPDNPDPPIATAKVRPGEGVNIGAWAIGLIALLIALVYGFNVLS
jgi:hypothetical protein